MKTRPDDALQQSRGEEKVSHRTPLKALPIDGSENEWEKLFGFPRHSISRALFALEENADQRPDSLYCRIKIPKVKNAEGSNTRPSRLYWEVQPLIKALTEARCSKHGIKRDALADATIQQLVHDLSDMDLSECSYQQVQLLQSPLIRKQLLQLFQKELDMRIEAIQTVTQNPPIVTADNGIDADAITINNILVLCESIDSKMANIVYHASYKKETDNKQDEKVEAIRALYKDLTSIREKITYYSAEDETYTTSFRALKNDANQKIIQQLEDLLSGPLEERANDIKAAYAEYLLTVLPPDSKAGAEIFAKNFMSIKNFMEEEHDCSHWLPTIRRHFVRRIIDIFNDVENLNPIGYAYMTPLADSSGTMFLDEYVMNACQNIQFKIHKPLTLLLKGKTLIQYVDLDTVENMNLIPRYPRKNEKNVSLFDEMKDAIIAIASDYPQLPVGPFTRRFSVKDFVKHYNKYIASEFKVSALTVQRVSAFLEATKEGSITNRLLAIMFFLQKASMLVAFAEMETTLVALQDLYDGLTSFYKNM